MARNLLSLLQFFALSVSLASASYWSRDELRRRQINPGQLRPDYDYIVVGGGQSGLVIANRLSEDSTKTVLVVEYGTFDDNPSQIEPASSTNYAARNLFNLTSVSQPNAGGRAGTIYAASVVGGGSTVNGMLFDRGSAEDYDNWEKLGNPGWGWEGLFPYFKKSTKFNTPPDPAIIQQYNITVDTSAYGTNGPIQVTYPPWQWPATKIQFQAWNEVGVPTQYEHAAGKAYNAFWVPSNVDNNIRRSYARNQYFDPARSRSNLHLLTWHRVNEVVFSSSKRAESVKIQQRGTSNGAATITVKSNKEIVLAAGWLHTPHILQRSGVGPAALLSQANIPLVVDLPGVGSNLQDHPAAFIQYTYTRDAVPNSGSLQSNATFRTWAQQQWQQRRGPMSVMTGNSMATVPYSTINPSGYQATINKVLGQTAATYLPRTYTATQVAGFVEQRRILSASLSSPNNGIFEIPFSGGASTALCLEKPFSRGTVAINTADRYAEPTVDYQANVNPVDIDLTVAVVRFYRRWMQAPSHQQLGPTEQSPGTGSTTDAQLSTWVTQSMTPSTAHTCGTAAMMPQNLGGVVSPELLVYGVTGLSVGDISLIPLIPATHTCATVYAIAEKAADLIKARAGTTPGDPTTTESSTTDSSTTTSSTTTTSSSSSSTTTTSTTTSSAPAPTQTHYGQCGGQDWKGPTVCASPYTCKYSNQWYSQCL